VRIASLESVKVTPGYGKIAGYEVMKDGGYSGLEGLGWGQEKCAVRKSGLGVA